MRLNAPEPLTFGLALFMSKAGSSFRQKILCMPPIRADGILYLFDTRDRESSKFRFNNSKSFIYYRFRRSFRIQTHDTLRVSFAHDLISFMHAFVKAYSLEVK